MQELAGLQQLRRSTVLQGPADQPWGLRVMLIEGPAGHRLRLGAEIVQGLG